MNDLLKFITCGSVDDGKSTLIGHMLYDAKLIFTDQENALILDSKLKNKDSIIDYSLLLDGLIAEREQGITIDVAYRYFNTKNRNFIVADTPGHEEYTRNMAVGASFADLAVVLVDATKKLMVQTYRHIYICSLMGIRDFVFAINKMDLVSYDEDVFEEIYKDIKKMMVNFSYNSLIAIPVSATEGDNIALPSKNIPWYNGSTLLNYLETINIQSIRKNSSFIMPVQRASRTAFFRGFQGQVASGEVKIGDVITVLPSNEQTTVETLLNAGNKVEKVTMGQSVTISLNREVDVSRGCIITTDSSLQSVRSIQTDLFWMDDSELLVGRSYLLRIGTKVVSAVIQKIYYKTDVNTGNKVPVTSVRKNDLISCDIYLSDSISVGQINQCPELERFILINRVTNMTSACGVIRKIIQSVNNVTWHNMDIDRDIRSNQLSQQPKTIWFTGLSGAGKSTIANALEKELISQGKHTMLLDGDNIRMGLNSNLGFSESDRIENIRRIAEVSKLMNDAGLIVLVSVISPYKADRKNAREIIGDVFFEIFVDTSLEECKRRDVKGLYKRAERKEISNFTGVSSRYERPETPELVVYTEQNTVDEIVTSILNKVKF